MQLRDPQAQLVVLRPSGSSQLAPHGQAVDPTAQKVDTSLGAGLGGVGARLGSDHGRAVTMIAPAAEEGLVFTFRQAFECRPLKPAGGAEPGSSDTVGNAGG